MLFSERHLDLVRENHDTAACFAARFYCIPGREWPRYRYDILTLADAAPSTPEGRTLARLEKLEYHREQNTHPGRERREFFRILLDDATILSALGLEADDGDKLGDLLLYVLTHELIHVIRFTNDMQTFEASIPDRLSEEKRVHRLTWDVLKPLRNKDIYDIHTRYMQAPLEDLSVSS